MSETTTDAMPSSVGKRVQWRVSRLEYALLVRFGRKDDGKFNRLRRRNEKIYAVRVNVSAMLRERGKTRYVM